MKKLDSGDYLVPAVRGSEAVELVRNQVGLDRADGMTAMQLDIPLSVDKMLWVVHPHWYKPMNHWDDAVLADAPWVSQVTPSGWNVTIDTKLSLLVIRNISRSLCLVQALPTESLFRGQLRSSFAQLGMVIG